MTKPTLKQIQALGLQIKNGLEPDKVETVKIKIRIYNDDLKCYVYTEPTNERAFYTLDGLTISCLNTDKAKQALAQRLINAKFLPVFKIPGYGSLKPSPFSWSLAVSMLTAEDCTIAENVNNYTEYLALYNMVPAYGIARTGYTIILTHLEPYQSKACPTMTDLYTSKAVSLTQRSVMVCKEELHHLPTGFLVVDGSHKNPEEKLSKLQGANLEKALKTLNDAPILNPNTARLTNHD